MFRAASPSPAERRTLAALWRAGRRSCSPARAAIWLSTTWRTSTRRFGGFSTGDEFDLAGFVYSSAETEKFTENGAHTSGLLTVTDGANVAKLTLLGNYVTSDFALSTDAHGGTFVKFV
jgi:hypothetical protein